MNTYHFTWILIHVDVRYISNVVIKKNSFYSLNGKTLLI